MNKSEPERRSCRDLTVLEKEVLGCIFRTILESGRAPSMEELQGFVKKSPNELAGILDELEKRDLLLRAKETQEIRSIYPFSLMPTRHEVEVEDGRKLFAMCAVDALGMPNMFRKDVKVVSECARCGQKVTIDVRDEEIAERSHPQIMIWNFESQQGPAAETCCPMVNFFCSDEHFKAWASDNQELSGKGKGERLEQAYPGIKERWKRYGQQVGLR